MLFPGKEAWKILFTVISTSIFWVSFKIWLFGCRLETLFCSSTFALAFLWRLSLSDQMIHRKLWFFIVFPIGFLANRHKADMISFCNSQFFVSFSLAMAHSYSQKCLIQMSDYTTSPTHIYIIEAISGVPKTGWVKNRLIVRFPIKLLHFNAFTALPAFCMVFWRVTEFQAQKLSPCGVKGSWLVCEGSIN